MGTDYYSHEKVATKCIVIHPHGHVSKAEAAGKAVRAPEACLEEAVNLTKAISLDCVYSECAALKTVVPGSLFGKGTIERLGAVITEYGAELAVVDYPLLPRQQSKLEKEWKCKVIDRTGLILEIFADRAQTAEGKLQVELAQCEYQKSRLVRAWTHLERQRATGKTGGPGEKQLELDKRMFAEQITRLKAELKVVEKRRKVQKSKRDSVPYPVVALVGYTNAGKSTLFNRLTKAHVMVKDMLFATLDPTMRELKLPSGRRVILSDTVGFISNLPTQLIAAFKATLEEVLEADLILHVQDRSSPSFAAEHDDVIHILGELGINVDKTGLITDVMNKVDKMSEDERRALYPLKPDECAVSALDGTGIDDLLAKIDLFTGIDTKKIRLVLPAVNGKALSWLYANGEVHAVSADEETEMLTVDVSLSEFKKGQCLNRFAEAVKVVY